MEKKVQRKVKPDSVYVGKALGFYRRKRQRNTCDANVNYAGFQLM